MPTLNPLTAVDSARNFMNIVKEVNFDEIRDRAEAPPRVLIVAREADHAEQFGRALFGADAGGLLEFRSGSQISTVEPSRYDIVVVTDPGRSGLLEEIRSLAGSGNHDHIFYLANEAPATISALRSEMLMSDPEIAPSVGRHFVDLRAEAIHTIIDSTSKANAKFALISNVPAIVPILGSILAAGADFIVLTKNQIMMSYKLAAANGRDLSDHTGIIRELVPVVGVGFVWRTVAREATSFLPLLAGTIPKVGIAYVGTYTVGRAVDYYYRFGTKPPKEQWELFRQQSLKLAANLPLLNRGDSDRANEDIEVTLEHSVSDAQTTRVTQHISDEPEQESVAS